MNTWNTTRPAKEASVVSSVETPKRKIYIAGPMRGIPFFNFPLFNQVAESLRFQGWEVFNPAERDQEVHGTDISAGNAEGSEQQAEQDHGFDLRRALADDTSWICLHADAIYMLPGWENSKGAIAEHSLAYALGLDIFYEGVLPYVA